MTSFGTPFAFTVCIVALVATMGIVTSLSNLLRKHRERRDTRIANELRPKLLSSTDVLGESIDLSTRAQRAMAISMARRMLPSLRGIERDELVAILENEGVIAVALAHARSRSAVTRAAAAELLGSAAVEYTAPTVMLMLRDKDADVRRAAARALGRIGHPGAIPALLKALDADRSIPLNTITMALQRIDPSGSGALIDGCAHGAPRARAISAELLGLSGSTVGVMVLTSALLRDSELEVRIRAARALGRIGFPSSVDVLADVLRNPKEPTPLRAVTVRALGEIGGARVVSLLWTALGSSDHVIAQNAAQGLARSDERGRELLQMAAAGLEGRRGAYAREALSMLELHEGIRARLGHIA